MFVTYIVHTQCSHLFKRYRVCPVVVILISPSLVARQSLQTSAAIMACDLPRQCKRLRFDAVEQGSRTESDNPMTAVKCYYCNTVILPPCLHIIDNLDGHESREEKKTIHKDCLHPYLQTPRAALCALMQLLLHYSPRSRRISSPIMQRHAPIQ